MAIAGSATPAFYVALTEDGLHAIRTTTQRSLCLSPEEAAIVVQAGGFCIVAGADLPVLRRILEKPDHGISQLATEE